MQHRNQDAPSNNPAIANGKRSIDFIRPKFFGSIEAFKKNWLKQARRKAILRPVSAELPYNDHGE